MHKDHQSTLEAATDAAAVRTELCDDPPVPFVRIRHALHHGPFEKFETCSLSERSPFRQYGTAPDKSRGHTTWAQRPSPRTGCTGSRPDIVLLTANDICSKEYRSNAEGRQGSPGEASR